MATHTHANRLRHLCNLFYLKKKGINSTISEGWWERFKHHQPNLTLQMPAPLSYPKAMAMDQEALHNYSDLLEGGHFKGKWNFQ